MELIGILRLVFLVLAGIIFVALVRQVQTTTKLKGLTSIGIGCVLIFLNMIVGSLFHSNLFSDDAVMKWLVPFGFYSGYVGQTVGLLVLLYGVYFLIRSMAPLTSEHYSSLVERSIVGVYLIQDGVFRFVNPHFAEIFGYERDELIGKPFDDLVAPESKELVSGNIQRRILGEVDSLHYEFTGLKKNGERLMVEVYGNRTTYENHAAIHGTLLDTTERREAFDKLKTSNELITEILENTADTFFSLDQHWSFTYLNPSTEKYLAAVGLNRKELLGKNIWKKFPFLFNTAGYNDLYRSMYEKVPMELVQHFEPMDKWFEIRAFPTQSGITVHLRDITEQVQSERLQSAMYRISELTISNVELTECFSVIHHIVGELMNATNFYIALHDESTHVVSFPYFVDEVDPPPTPKQFGKGLTEFVLRTGEPLLAPPDKFNELVASGEVESIGAPSLDWLGVPLKTGDKTFGIACVQSYSEQHRYGEKEKEILIFISQHIARFIQQKSDEERFHAIWENSAAGMRLTDKDGTIMMVNPAFCAMAKLPEEQLVGKKFSVTYLPQYAMETENDYRKNFETETVPARLPGELRLWNGDSVAVEVQHSFIHYGANQKMLLTIFQDVTEQKKLEEQLLHAQKMESIGTLAGGIAHDFNNVLSMVLSAAEVMKMKAGDPTQVKHYADIVSRAAERGAGIARQLLLFARSEKTSMKPMHLSEIISEVDKLLQHSMPKTISIKTEIAAGEDLMMGDADQLHQAVLNLALNARDAVAELSPGKILISVKEISSAEIRKHVPECKNGNYIAVSVSDNGKGIDMTLLPRIFEPFFSTKERGKGTGLGLSIVHGIVKSHDGYIHVESVKGKGSTFTLFIPLLQERATNKPTTSKTIQAPSPPLSAGTRTHRSNVAAAPTILVADDEEMLRAMLKEILQNEGWNVITAVDGIDAVEQYRAQWEGIDLVISDIGMPRMGGEEAFQEMRRINPAAKVIFATGFVDGAVKKEMEHKGVNGIVNKPFRFEEIIAVTKSVLLG
ncbi:MAG: PAS domain S-box protein [Bacteroidota bacterium]|nr:PAS domain S-box protein [Bacteroidota bacterium]